MRIVLPQVEIVTPLTEQTGKEMLQHIERIARTCYKSELKITDGSAEKMINTLVKSGHLAMIEHASVSFKFICSRAASHQLVRHRIASYAQESQRYCNYSQDKFDNSITFIKPPSITDDGSSDGIFTIWANSLSESEVAYFTLIEAGAKPQEARLVLPNATKTEVNVTMNLRELRAFFELRCDSHADDEIRCLAKTLLIKLHNYIPVVFDDLYIKFIDQDSSIATDEVFARYESNFINNIQGGSNAS